MALWPLTELIGYLKDGVTRALTIKGEVTQVGSIVKVLKDYLAEPFDVPTTSSSNGTVHYGEDRGIYGSQVIKLDTSLYPHVTIYFNNNTDAALILGVIPYPKGGVSEDDYLGSGGTTGLREISISDITVSAGNSKILKSVEYLSLNRTAGISLFITNLDAATTGTFDVVFQGSKV